MPGALTHLKRDRHAPGRVRRNPQPHTDGGKQAECQQILARILDRDGTVARPGMQQQPPADESFMHTLQTLEADLANLHARSGGDVKTQVQHLLVRILVSKRRIDLGKGITFILQRRQQAGASGQHIGGDRRSAGREPEAAARVVREGAIDLDTAEVVEGSEIEPDAAERILPLRQRAQSLTQAGRIERKSVDRDRDPALVVPKGFEHGDEPIHVASGAGDQPEGAYGSRRAQRCQLRG